MKNRKIRVLHALGWIASGGVEQIRLLLARGLPQGRYEHLVICQESFGDVAERLRFSDIIKAMPSLVARYPEVRLLIIGDGPDRAMLQQLAGTLGVSETVLFASYQGNARDFYSLMDVFVLASAHEAFGLVFVEAMLAGVPIVGTAVGGIPFVLNDGKAGVLVPPFQPAALASAISGLLSDDASRMRFAEAGLERARMEFSGERYCQQIDALYSNNLSGRQAAP